MSAILLLLLSLAAGPPAPEPVPALLLPPPRLSFADPVYDFGEVYQFASVEHRFPVTNQSDQPVRILAAEAVSNAATVRFAPAVLPPGGSGEITVTQPVGDKLGVTAFRVKVQTDDPGLPEKKLTLKGFIQSAYDPEHGLLDWGEVDRSAGASQELELASREAAAVHFLGLEDAPGWLAAEVVGAAAPGEPLKLRVAVKPGAPLGAQSGRLRLRTDLPQQPWFVVPYRLAVFGDVRPSVPTIDLGWVRLGQSAHSEVRLTSRRGTPFRVERVDGAPAGLTVAVAPCAGEGEPPCQALQLAFKPETIGNLVGVLSVHLAGQSEPLPLPFGALAISPSTPIKEMDLSAASASPPPATLPFTPESGASRPPAPPAAPSHERQVRLKWQASREQGVYGYLVYRAESRSGPFRRISGEIVRVPGDGEPLHAYRYVDSAVEPGKTYYYYLDTVSEGGRKRGFSGVLERAVAADAS